MKVLQILVLGQDIINVVEFQLGDLGDLDFLLPRKLQVAALFKVSHSAADLVLIFEDLEVGVVAHEHHLEAALLFEALFDSILEVVQSKGFLAQEKLDVVLEGFLLVFLLTVFE